MKPPGWWQRYLGWRQRHASRLTVDDCGFTVFARSTAQRVEWASIRQVAAFKRDLFAVDMLYVAVTTPDGIVEIDEEMPGYAAVEEQLAARLGFDAEWKLRVLFPAFAPNFELLFDAVEPKE